MNLLIIFNPNAGHGRSKKILPQIKTEFASHDISIDVKFTEYRGHGKDMLQKMDVSAYDGVIAAGGDGTVFDVINGLMGADHKPRCRMGVLPVGTGNAFARELNLFARDWKEAIQIIARGQTKKIDAGHFKTAEEARYYLNILGLGFVADVSQTATKLKLFGNSAYILGVLYQLIFLNNFKLTIELDGEKIEQDNIFVEVSNTRYTGTTFLMAPEAIIDDGLLDVTLLRKTSRRRILKVLPTIFTGEHVGLEEVTSRKAKHIKISTETRKILTPDGELLGYSPVEITCLPKSVEVFWR
ncbi:MAG: diacylglycerol kinase family lipid kinase [Deferribacteres bacterium]|nr:diacylglycerol kinase family lipid kinase [candidate division KSB1 bacterium]MCB9503909.1 diacylglycerol kinase family lipid kinase [Deferribacteres bacterium]